MYVAAINVPARHMVLPRKTVRLFTKLENWNKCVVCHWPQTTVFQVHTIEAGIQPIEYIATKGLCCTTQPEGVLAIELPRHALPGS